MVASCEAMACNLQLLGGFLPTPLKNDGLNVSWDDFPFPTEWFSSKSSQNGSSHHQPDDEHNSPVLTIDNPYIPILNIYWKSHGNWLVKSPDTPHRLPRHGSLGRIR
jgi:hypothetical protein